MLIDDAWRKVVGFRQDAIEAAWTVALVAASLSIGACVDDEGLWAGHSGMSVDLRHMNTTKSSCNKRRKEHRESSGRCALNADDVKG